MVRDYKGKTTRSKLGLRRGKSSVKREISPPSRRRVFLWSGLFVFVIILNYVFMVYLGPSKKTQTIPSGNTTKEVHEKPLDFKGWFNKAFSLYKKGEFDGALKAYNKAIELRPEEFKSYFNRGLIYVKMGKYNLAIEDYSRIINSNPDYTEAYNNRAWAFLKKGAPDKAIRDCDKALLLDPGLAAAYHTRGMAYKNKGLLDRARKNFRKSCRLGDQAGCSAYKQ